MTLTEKVYAVRAKMVDGATVDLLLFADYAEAVNFTLNLRSQKLLGFDEVIVVPRRVIGEIVERRIAPRESL